MIRANYQAMFNVRSIKFGGNNIYITLRIALMPRRMSIAVYGSYEVGAVFCSCIDPPI